MGKFKIFDKSLGGIVYGDSTDISYDNKNSKIESHNVQNAIDEIVNNNKNFQGKNIIPYYKIESTPLNGLTCTQNSDGSHTVSGTTTAVAFIVIFRGQTTKTKLVECEKTYTLSTNIDLPTGVDLILSQRTVSNSTITEYIVSETARNITFSPVDDSTWDSSIVFYRIQKGVTINLTLYTMLEEGSIAHLYEPITMNSVTLSSDISKINNNVNSHVSDSTVHVTPTEKTSWTNKADKSHTHNYAGSSSAGGSATSAVKLDTTTAGSATQPVYFSGGKPVATTYTLGKSVPSNAVFTDTTYSNMTAASASAAGKAGLVPAPAAGKQGQFLRGDGTWATPTNTTYSNFVKSGTGAKAGLVPAPSTTAGTTKYLREDGTWQVPTNTNTWRGIQNNLTSDSTSDSLSAAQGKVLKSLIDGKAASSHTHDDRYYTESEIDTKINTLNNKLGSTIKDIRVVGCVHSNDVSINISPYASGCTEFNYDFSSQIPNGYSFLFGIWGVAWISGNNNGVIPVFNYPISDTSSGKVSVNGVGVYLPNTGSYMSLTFRPYFLLFCIKK